MTKDFEEIYPNYSFAPLVKFGIKAASYIASLMRKQKTAPSISDTVPNPGRTVGGATAELQQLAAANKRAENANKAA